MSWLLNRLYSHQDLPLPRFAFQGTINWMRALAILVDEGTFENTSLSRFYRATTRRAPTEEADTLALGHLLMALHNSSSLDKLAEQDEPYSCVRSAIITWYYALYNASKAMIAATCGADPQTHADTSRIFQTELVNRGLVVAPFDLSITDLTPANITAATSLLRAGNTHHLANLPTNQSEAFGAAVSYLKGTAEYRKEEIEERIKCSPDFRALGVSDFRTNAAKALRDSKLTPASVNFLVEAFRYRGKANYRDAFYLSCGPDYTDELSQFNTDLARVSAAFINMSSHYISRRVIRQNWRDFSSDITANARFPLPIDLTTI